MAAEKHMFNRGAWTAEEDRKLAKYIEQHGVQKWRTVASKSGLNRCGKSCRLRWLNYLRPNIKRGNISEAEEDLIIRLHKLLGNRWSLIAGRLPGRTDNEIKNYWNSHLSKKMKGKQKTTASSSAAQDSFPENSISMDMAKVYVQGVEGSGDKEIGFNENDFFDFSSEGTNGLEFVNKFLGLDQDAMHY